MKNIKQSLAAYYSGASPEMMTCPADVKRNYDTYPKFPSKAAIVQNIMLYPPNISSSLGSVCCQRLFPASDKKSITLLAPSICKGLCRGDICTDVLYIFIQNVRGHLRKVLQCLRKRESATQYTGYNDQLLKFCSEVAVLNQSCTLQWLKKKENLNFLKLGEVEANCFIHHIQVRVEKLMAQAEKRKQSKSSLMLV